MDRVTNFATPYQLLPELPSWEFESLKESIRRHGVLLPVVKDERGVTIDGHHRERACRELGITDFPVMTLAGLSEAEKRDHALLLNLVRRKLTRRQLREIIAAEIRRSPELSNNWLGGVLGVSKNTVAAVRADLEAAGEVVKLTTFTGRDGKRHPATKVLTHRAADAERARNALAVLGEDAPRKPLELRLVERRARKKERLARIVREHEPPSVDEAIRLYHCRFQELEATAGIEPGSVDLMLTDVPYDLDFLRQASDLGEFAARVLKPGGVFCTYTGVANMAGMLAELSRHLTYRAVAFSSWSGEGPVLQQLQCVTQATPLLIFSNGPWTRSTRWYNDFHNSTGEQDWHPWQKQLADVEHWLTAFSEEGEVCCDPLGGGFTTAVACTRLGRRFVGCDCEERNVAAGQQRLAEEFTPSEIRLLPR